jgi:hypothetical protein
MLYGIMSVGIFLSSLASAGRQSVVQIILFVIFIEALRRRQLPKVASAERQWVIRGPLVASALGVLLFVTASRSIVTGSRTKADIFLVYFNAEIVTWAEEFLFSLGSFVRDLTVESLLYASSSVPLFSVFNEIKIDHLFYGVFTFPFFMRQIEPLTGISVVESLNMRNQLLGSAQVIGTGWTTAPSHLVLDYGPVGMGLIIFIQGFASEWSWMRARSRATFGISLVCVVLTICAVYMPFLPAIADTNLFLFLMAVLTWMAITKYRRGKIARLAIRPHPSA